MNTIPIIKPVSIACVALSGTAALSANDSAINGVVVSCWNPMNRDITESEKIITHENEVEKIFSPLLLSA